MDIVTLALIVKVKYVQRLKIRIINYYDCATCYVINYQLRGSFATSTTVSVN